MIKYLVPRLAIIIVVNIVSFTQAQQMQPQVQFKSPEVYAFEKYGNVPVNLYTGSLDLRVPIYSLAVGDGKTIQINLSYDSSGFIPHKKNDNAGVNWNLFAGGRITRTVNMIPDEYIGEPTAMGTSPFGEPLDIHGHLHGTRIQPFSNTQVYNLNSGAGNTNDTHWWLGSSANKYEGEPDTYHFSILDLQGKFMIGNDGKVLVESNDPGLKVDVSQISSYGKSSGTCIPANAIIKLRDSRGNLYTFGGDMSKYEIPYYRSTPVGSNHNGYSGFPAITSYSISKINFFDGSVAEFEYLEPTTNTHATAFCNVMNPGHESWIKANPALFSVESFSSYGSTSYSWVNCPNGPNFCSSIFSSAPAGGDTYLLLKKSVLSKIKYKDATVQINYQDAGYSIKHHKLNASLQVNEALISNIQVYYKDQLLKNTIFEYDHLGGSYKRSFLKRLIFSGEDDNKYEFEYYNTNNLPPYYTNGIDHWGFWNGRDENLTLTAFDTYNSVTGDYTLNNTIRDPNTTKFNVGLLSKIIYPTKGSTVFEYETPSYGKRVERNSFSNFLPTLTNNSGIIGGARILRKQDYSATGQLARQVRYQYTTSINNNISSGILMNWPRYLYYFEFHAPGAVQKLVLQSSTNVQQNTLDSYNIGYSKVFEIEEGNGYTEYNFSNYEDTPDILAPDTNNIRNYLTGMGQPSPENLYKNYRNLYGVDKSILRGKIKGKKTYTQSGYLLREEITSYIDNIDFNPNTANDNNNYVAIQHLSGMWVQGYKKYFNPYGEKSVTTKEYTPNGAIESTVTNEFKSPKHFKLSNVLTNNSLGENIEIKYEYVDDLSTGPVYDIEYPHIYFLADVNRVSEPIVTYTYKNGEKINEKKIRHYYSSLVGNAVPESIHERKDAGPINSWTYEDARIYFLAYDMNFNLLRYRPDNGIFTQILWGYNKQYPIAKIENDIDVYTDTAFKNYLTNIENLSNTDNSNCMGASSGGCIEAQMRALFNTMREQFPTISLTSYTYDPLVGMTSVTYPDGRVEYYEYDSFERLKLVKDQNGNIIKKIDYNFKD